MTFKFDPDYLDGYMAGRNHASEPDVPNTPLAVAKHEIGYDLYQLQSVIQRLWKARLNPLTADIVLESEADLWSAAGTLRSLLEDVRSSNDGKSKLEAAE